MLSLRVAVSTDKPSMAKRSSMNSMPAASHASTSESLIWRLASEMSVSPEQNFLKPSPVPGPSTVMPTSGFSARKASALSADTGSTVDDPEMRMDPLMESPGVLSASVEDAAGGKVNGA